MRHGWIREGKGLPTPAEQRTILLAAGVEADRIARDDPPRGRGHPPKGRTPPFDYLLQAVRRRDVVVISNAACLAPTKAEALVRLAAIGTKGGALFDAGTGETVEDEAGVRRFAERAERALAYTRLDRARKKLEAMGRSKAAETWRRTMRPDWDNPDMTAAMVAEKHGLKRRQVFNIFKGVPKA